jgi:hypothetical protein
MWECESVLAPLGGSSIMNGPDDEHGVRHLWLHGPSPIPRASLLSAPSPAEKFLYGARRPGHADTDHLGEPISPLLGGLVSLLPLLRRRMLGVLNEIRLPGSHANAPPRPVAADQNTSRTNR